MNLVHLTSGATLRSVGWWQARPDNERGGKAGVLTDDNRASMDRLLKQGHFDIVVSTWPDQLEHMLRDTKAMEAQVAARVQRFIR